MTAIRFVVAVFLGFFVSLLYVNSVAAQTPQPTPPQASTVVGYLDVWYGGWAVDVVSPNDSISVVMEIETPGSSTRTLPAIVTNFDRSDVNAVLGVGGVHGFNLSDDMILRVCDGEPHTMRAYGVPVNGGDRVELPWSRPDAGKITCGTKAKAIIGTVTDVQKLVNVTLGQFDESGRLQFRNSAYMLGTAYAFGVDYNGDPLPDGEYQATVSADGYVVSRVRFSYTKASGASVTHNLQLSPLTARLNGSMLNIDPTTGETQVPVKICNNSYSSGWGGEYDRYVAVTVLITGPAKYQEHGFQQPLYTSIDAPSMGRCRQYNFNLMVDPKLPNGEDYCPNLLLSNGIDEPLAAVFTCAPKGVREDQGLSPKG